MNYIKFILVFVFLMKVDVLFSQVDSVIVNLENQVVSNPNKSLVVIDRLLNKHDSLTSIQEAKLLKFKGDVFIYNKNYKKALNAFNKSYSINKLLGNKNRQIQLLLKISDLYIYQENFTEVIDIQNQLATLLEGIDKNDLESSRYFSNMSDLFLKTGNTKKALNYSYKAIENAKKGKDTILLSAHYNDLSRIFIINKQLDSALYYSNKPLSYCIKKNEYLLRTKLLMNLGEIYELKQDYIDAERQYQKVIRILENHHLNSAHVYRKLANFYKRVGLYYLASKEYKNAISKIKSTENENEILDIYFELTENSLLDNNTKLATKYFYKYKKLNAKLSKDNQLKSLEYINKRYDMQEQEMVYLNNRHRLTEKEIELKKQQEITSKNRVIIMILLLFFGVLFFLGILYTRYTKVVGERKNIYLKNKVLRLQMNPHFIFNSLTVIQNSVIKNDRLKSAEIIAIFSKLIRQNLDFSNRNEISITEEIDMLENYLNTQKFRFNDMFSFKINIGDDIDCENDFIPPMLLQPFVENSIEHGLKNKKKGGKIEITIKNVKNKTYFSIIDNGIGFNKKIKSVLAQPKNEVHAIDIFKERLQIRQKKEEESFVIKEIVLNDKVVGTKVEFYLINEQ